MTFKSRPSILDLFTSTAKKSFNTLVGRSSQPPPPRTLSPSSSFDSGWVDPEHLYDPFFVARQEATRKFDDAMFNIHAETDTLEYIVMDGEDHDKDGASFYRLQRSRPCYNLNLLAGDPPDPPASILNAPPALASANFSVSASTVPVLPTPPAPPVLSVRPAPPPPHPTVRTTPSLPVKSHIFSDKPLPTLPPVPCRLLPKGMPATPRTLRSASAPVSAPASNAKANKHLRVVSSPLSQPLAPKATGTGTRSVRFRRRLGRANWSYSRPRLPSVGIEPGTIDFTKTPELGPVKAQTSKQSLRSLFRLDDPPLVDNARATACGRNNDPVEKVVSPVDLKKSGIVTASPESDLVLVFTPQPPVDVSLPTNSHQARGDDPVLHPVKVAPHASRHGWGHFKSLSSTTTKDKNTGTEAKEGILPGGRRRLPSRTRSKITEDTYVPDLAARHERAASLSRSMAQTAYSISQPLQPATAPAFRPRHRPSPSLHDVFQFKNKQFDIPVARAGTRNSKSHVKATSLDSVFTPVSFNEVPTKEPEAPGTLNNGFRFPVAREGGTETLTALWPGEYNRPSNPDEQVGPEEEAAVKRLILLRSQCSADLCQDSLAALAAMPPIPPRPRRQASLSWSENRGAPARSREHPPNVLWSRHRPALSTDSGVKRLSAVFEGDEIDAASLCGLETFIRESQPEDWAGSEGRHSASSSVGLTRSPTMTSLVSEEIVTPDKGQSQLSTTGSSKRYGFHGGVGVVPPSPSPGPRTGHGHGASGSAGSLGTLYEDAADQKLAVELGGEMHRASLLAFSEIGVAW